MPEKFSITARVRSFKYAFAGFGPLFIEQHNARIHGLAVLLVVALGLYLKLPARDWALLALTMGLVLMAEAMNSAIEYLADEISGEYSQKIKKTKDVAAAGVLLAAMAALVVAGCILLPPTLALF